LKINRRISNTGCNLTDKFYY